MRTIRKSTEPASLARYRQTPGANYDDLEPATKAELRDALIREQRHLCCYCMGRILAEHKGCRIEHWQSQTDHPQRQLDYRNLLAACNGSEGSGHDHCDVRKKDQSLSRSPAEPAHAVESLIRYHGNGRVISSDPQFDRELNQVLNLNSPNLVERRKKVLDGFVCSLKGTVSRARWQRIREQWYGSGSTGPMREFAMVIVYFADKKLARSTD